uniref:Uncharacterized protein n=1 Tax=Leersia perrieri TaxID=77586 RepID=A0A0D9W5L7_9ORYZ
MAGREEGGVTAVKLAAVASRTFRPRLWKGGEFGRRPVVVVWWWREGRTAANRLIPFGRPDDSGSGFYLAKSSPSSVHIAQEWLFVCLCVQRQKRLGGKLVRYNFFVPREILMDIL